MSYSKIEIDNKLDKMSDLINANNDIVAIKGFNNAFQVSAYKHKKNHEKHILWSRVVFKLASEISIIVGAVSALVQIFL